MYNHDKVKQRLRLKAGINNVTINTDSKQERQYELTLSVKLTKTQLEKMLKMIEDDAAEHTVSLVALL